MGQVATGQPCHASHLARLPIPATAQAPTLWPRPLLAVKFGFHLLIGFDCKAKWAMDRKWTFVSPGVGIGVGAATFP
ncbi:MAG TPA: hypothetical protein VL728_16335 [Cyclobacteriaceae bacterium]|nr:hypothetical protein [Cyclobacteriaceae bacterium]